jgi:serpin B
MTRIPMLAYGVLGLVSACNATNTGNPNLPGGAPDGVELVRSHLERNEQPAVSAADRASFGRDSRQLSFDLYQQVKDGQNNTFISPYSIAVALAMTYAGAEAETQTEMASALDYALPEPALHAAFNATDLALQGRAHELAGSSGAAERSSGDGLQLNVVNATFGQKDIQFKEAFLDVLALNYGAGMFRADFAAHADRERLAINRWVELQTRDRIKDLLPEGSIDSDVALVLVNAIYFKASWLTPFEVSATEQAAFHAPAGDVMVPMMHGRAEQYTKGDGYQAAELPYISPAVRMLFILPDAGRFEDIESVLDAAFFDRVRGAFAHYGVDLKLPRFSFEAGVKLKPALQALGMKQAFEVGVADLSGIAGQPGDLYIDQVFHKAFIAVDEQGTEAAAATAVVATRSSAPPPATFVLDRPFIFVIYDEPTGQILFVGRLMTPG